MENYATEKIKKNKINRKGVLENEKRKNRYKNIYQRFSIVLLIIYLMKNLLTVNSK